MLPGPARADGHASGMTEDIYIGGDPGVSGAIAAINRDRKVLLLEDFPTVTFAKAPKKRTWIDKKGKERTAVHKSRRELDFKGLTALMYRIVDLPGKKYALIERVTSRHTDSGVVAFTFGGAFWALQQAFADFELNYELVNPKEWQAHCLGEPEKEKEKRRKQYLERARVLFPQAELTYLYHADRAAALLIADYCCEMATYQNDNLVDLDDVEVPDINLSGEQP